MKIIHSTAYYKS